jgi:hypothetical protein
MAGRRVLARARHSGHSEARWLTNGGAIERGVHGESILASPWCGWRWRHSVWAALEHGEKRRGMERGAVENGRALPLYKGRRGGHRPLIKMKKRSLINGDETSQF